MSEPNKDGTDIMMALLMGLSGPRASKAWNESQQIKAESFLTMAEHWINQTAEENARLKAEVERLTAFTTRTIIPNEELQAENARLKAEVERLTECITVNPAKVEGMELKMQILRRESAYLILDQAKETERLNVKIEWLTKAGDAMVEIVNGTYCVHPPQALIDWNAAKEGKQS
jgi:leucyl-tRNA synthetase